MFGRRSRLGLHGQITADNLPGFIFQLISTMTNNGRGDIPIRPVWSGVHVCVPCVRVSEDYRIDMISLLLIKLSINLEIKSSKWLCRIFTEYIAGDIVLICVRVCVFVYFHVLFKLFAGISDNAWCNKLVLFSAFWLSLLEYIFQQICVEALPSTLTPSKQPLFSLIRFWRAETHRNNTSSCRSCPANSHTPTFVLLRQDMYHTLKVPYAKCFCFEFFFF